MRAAMQSSAHIDVASSACVMAGSCCEYMARLSTTISTRTTRTRRTHTGSVMLHLLLLSAYTVHASLQPLTEITPTPEELAVFPATVLGAVDKLGLARSGAVVHLIGTSSVEALADWTPVCDSGVTLVMVGPEAVPLAHDSQAEGGCVSVVRGVYSRAIVASSSNPHAATAADPDVIVLLNADLYHIQWRRSLAELLLSRKPLVVTTYCE